MASDNPLAFPLLYGNGDLAHNNGMTLRDWFAGQALPAIIAATSAGQHHLQGVGTVTDMLAQEAYRLANAMLAEREKSDGQ